jgi:hypothetical protein
MVEVPSSGPFDASGSVEAALWSAYGTQGPSVLRDPAALRATLSSVAAVWPRETESLVIAARGGITDMITQQVTGPDTDPSVALRWTAGRLSQRTGLDPDACVWATKLFARLEDLSDKALAGFILEARPPLIEAAPHPQPAGGRGPVPAKGLRSNRRPLLFGVTVVVVVAITGYVGAANAAHLPPFSKGNPGAASPAPVPKTSAPTTTAAPVPAAPATATATAPATAPATAARESAPRPAAALEKPAPATTVANPRTAATQSKTVTELVPADIQQTTGCRSHTPPMRGLVGLTAALECSDASLPGGTVYGAKFASSADYAASVRAFNSSLSFDTATAVHTCPPQGGTQGAGPWWDNSYPLLSGQILECLTVGAADIPTLAWLYPSENALFEVQSSPGGSLLALCAWWMHHADAAGAA